MTSIALSVVSALVKRERTLNLCPKIPYCWDSLRAPGLLCSSVKVMRDPMRDPKKKQDGRYHRQNAEPTAAHRPCRSWMDSDARRHCRVLSSSASGHLSHSCGRPPAESSKCVAAASGEISSEVSRPEPRLRSVLRLGRKSRAAAGTMWIAPDRN